MERLETLNREVDTLESKIKRVQKTANKTLFSNGSLIETAVSATMFGVLSLPIAIATTPFVLAIESVVTLPRIILSTVKSGITITHNTNVKRAKTSLTKLEKQLESVREEIGKLTNDEECVN